MTDRQFTHPNFGREVRVEITGREVCLVFVANTTDQAEDFAAHVLAQLKAGALHITMMGEPISTEEI